MYFIKFLLSITFVTLFLIGCNKTNNYSGDKILPDIYAPVVTYTKPAIGGSFNSLYPINIIGTVTDNQQLQNYALTVYECKLDTIKAFEANKTFTTPIVTGYTINENFVRSNPNNLILNYMLTSKATDLKGNFKVDTIVFNLY